MATFIATYDLKWSTETPYTEFQNQAVKHGWRLWILADNNVWYRLPNTTLVGEFSDIAAAEKALQDTRAATASSTGKTVEMTKWIISVRGASRFGSDEHQKAK